MNKLLILVNFLDPIRMKLHEKVNLSFLISYQLRHENSNDFLNGLMKPYKFHFQDISLIFFVVFWDSEKKVKLLNRTNCPNSLL